MSIEIPIKIGLSGYYKIERIINGRCETVCDWFPNLITDNGLDLFAKSSGKFDYCSVGSGNDSPANTDTQLQSVVSSTNNRSTDGGIDTNENYVYRRIVYNFTTGSATGNLSEVGVGADSGGNNLFSRSLIKDSNGDPTTITVLSDEQLRVTYEARLHQPLSDFMATVDGHDLVIRSSEINTYSTTQFSWGAIEQSITLDGGVAYDGSIGSNTGRPSGSSDSASNWQWDAYVDGSFTRTGSLRYEIDKANFMISAVFFRWECAGSYQFSISPAIDKSNTEELTITVRVTWARQGELPS